jgi:WD40 repeat protein/DNA-binding winged helix-turn-helix (wHTH) protein
MASSSPIGPKPPSDATRFGDCTYDPQRRELRRGEAAVDITTKAFDLLGILIDSRPRVLTKEELRDRLWPGVAVGDTSLAKLVTELRQATGDDAREPRFIRTVHRYGYAFCGDVVEDSLGQEGEVVERSPYPGLRPFAEAEAAIFFGRDREVDALWEKLPARRLLALIGASGAGKTSFVRAGAVPARPNGWAAVVCTPGNAPLRMLGQALAPELAADPEALKGLLQFDDPTVAVGVVGRWRRAHAQALLVVDQAEELFTLSPNDVQRAFASLLGRMLQEADVHILLSLRDDFLMRCHEHAALAAVFDGLIPFGPPRAEDLRRALVEPAAKYGYRFEDEAVVDAMLSEVEGVRGALPLIAFAAAQLWERRDRAKRILTRAAYREIGGVAGALAQHAEATIERIGMDRSPAVRELFRNLVSAQGTRSVRERGELLSVFPDPREAGRVLDALIDARLLVAYDGSSAEGEAGRRIEVIHESLLTAWPRLVRWQAQDAEGALLRGQLRQATQLWEERGRPDDLLWTGTSFREYELWRERYRGQLTASEESFAAAMTSRTRRRRRRQRVARFAVLAAALGIAAATSALWRRSEASRSRAEEQTARAEASRVLALGRLALEDDPTAALAYATASVEMADTPEARRFALEALWRGPAAFFLPLPPGEWWRLDVSPDDRWVAVSSFGETVLVYPSSGGSPLSLGGHDLPARQRNVRFGPSGRQLFTNAEVDPIRVWSIPEGTLARTMDLGGRTLFDLAAGRLVTITQPAPGAKGLVQSWPLDGERGTVLGGVPMEGGAEPAVDPSGRWLAFARRRAVFVRPIDGLGGTGERVLGEHPHDVTRIAFDLEGTRLLSRDKEGGIRIWPLNASSPRPLRAFQTGASGIARFGPGGAGVVVGDPRTRSVALWTLDGPPDAEPLLFRSADNGNVMDTDVTSDGRWLAFANRESVIFWPQGRTYPHVLKGHVEPVMNLAFAANGDWLASGSLDGTVRMWPLRPEVAQKGSVVLGPAGSVYGLAVDGSGLRLLAALMKQPSAQVLTPLAQGATLPRPLHPAVTAPWGVAFDRAGCHAVVASGYSPAGVGMMMRIWDLASGTHRDIDLRAGVPRADASDAYEGGVVDLEPAPDGRILSAGFGGVQRWNPHDDSREFLARGEFGRSDLSPDGHTLAVVSLVKRPFFGELMLLDVETRRTSTLPSHGRQVMDVAFGPGGRTIITASADGAVRVGPRTGEEPHLLLGHEGGAEGLAVSPDGQWIASSGHDGTVRLWPMPDVDKPALHTLSRDALLDRLRSLTNLRAVADSGAQTGWKLEVGPFPGWEKAPTW